MKYSSEQIITIGFDKETKLGEIKKQIINQINIPLPDKAEKGNQIIVKVKYQIEWRKKWKVYTI